MAMGGLSRETAIVAKAPEEVNTTTVTTAAWRVGTSVLISNANFMPGACGEGRNCVKNGQECAREGRLCKRREPGTMQLAKVMATASPWFVGVGKHLLRVGLRNFSLLS
jgi:hypothetical protein